MDVPLNGGTPNLHPKTIIFVGKPMVVGETYQILGTTI